MTTPRLNLLLVALIMLALFSACKKEKTSWGANYTAPILKSEFSIEQLISGTNVQSNADSSLKLVLEHELVNIELDDAFHFPNTAEEFGSSLQTLEFPDDSASQSVNLGTIAAAAGFGGLVNALNGSPFALPAFNNINVAPITIDNSDVFETMTLAAGKMEVTITNGLPVELLNLDLEIRNDASLGGAVIGNAVINTIPVNQTETRIIDLAGKTINAQLIAALQPFSTAASNGAVMIDTSDALIAKVKIYDLVPTSATAIWPEQNLIDTTSFFSIPNSGDMMMKEMVVKEGDIDIDVFSSLQDSMYITYTVPNLVKDGVSFQSSAVVPPAPVNGVSKITRSLNFNGYTFKFNGYGIESTYGSDLNGNSTVDPDTINSYVHNVKVRMNYTGQMKTLSKSDTVYINAQIKNIVPAYASGYLGKDTLDIGPSMVKLDQFKGYLGGALQWEDVDLSLNVQNGVGAAGTFEIKNISGKNTANNNAVALIGTPLIGKINIASSAETSISGAPVSPAITSLSLDGSNSNAPAFLSNLPSELHYEIKSIFNGNLAVPGYTDVINAPPNFLYSGEGFSATMNMELPLSLIADSLTLTDTLDFSISQELESEETVNFSLIVDNGFAFDAVVSLKTWSSNSSSLTLLDAGVAQKGTVDPNSGKVTSSKRSVIEFSVTKEQFQHFKEAEKMVATIQLHNYKIGASDAQFDKIYSSNKINISIVAGTLKRFEF